MNNIVYSLTVCFTVIFTAFILSVISYCCTRQSNTDGADTRNVEATEDSNQAAAAAAVTVMEPCLDDQTMVCMYPKVLCSSSSKAKLWIDEEDDGISSSPCCCSICLMDYKESDLLRVLPKCGHFFHLKCVDPWFTMHLTCPICRSSVKNFQNISESSQV
ncbi:RING-H2 finger protein ATL70-like [Neltuma alba]|uniref:RING-H2 finger protein ATL70-like n=1 Tax=Neltuma alba TaxID=207710 RepID=UPI0010A2BC23|nr:RING-H2 finger protein ATL70-like [Prosopis alba]